MAKKSIKKSSVNAIANRGKLILGTGKTFKEASNMNVKDFKTLINKPNISDATAKGYQRNLRKLDPTNKNYNANDAKKCIDKMKKDWIKAGFNPSVFDNEIIKAEGKIGGDGGGGGGGGPHSGSNLDRFRNWVIDNSQYDEKFVDSLDNDDFLEFCSQNGWY